MAHERSLSYPWWNMTNAISTLTKPSVTRTPGKLRLSSIWRSADGSECEVFFEIEASDADLARIQPHGNAFLVALIVPAMERGEDLHFDAPVDPELVDNINECVMPLMLSMFPMLQPVTFTASENDTLPLSGERRGASTGMSCGIDSLCTLGSSKSSRLSDRQKISRFVFHDVGASGIEGRNGPLFHERLARSARVAAAEDLELVKVYSNIAEIYRTNFVRTHTLRNAAASLVLIDLVDTYLYSSTFAYSGIHGGQTWDSATADPILLPLLSTDSFKMLSSNASKSRLEKTLDYLNAPLHLDEFDICTSSDPGTFQNCGRCGKCGRFLLVAEARGELDTYGHIFDLDAFQSARWENVKRLVKWSFHRNFNPNDLDHLRYLKNRKAYLPTSAYLAGRLAALWTFIKPSKR